MSHYKIGIAVEWWQAACGVTERTCITCGCQGEGDCSCESCHTNGCTYHVWVHAGGGNEEDRDGHDNWLFSEEDDCFEWRSGPRTLDDGCYVCGCSREHDEHGDRVCGCAACWSGCCHVMVTKVT